MEGYECIKSPQTLPHLPFKNIQTKFYKPSSSLPSTPFLLSFHLNVLHVVLLLIYLFDNLGCLNHLTHTSTNSTKSSFYLFTHARDSFSIFLLVTTISLLTLSLVIASSNFSTYTNSPYLSVW